MKKSTILSLIGIACFIAVVQANEGARVTIDRRGTSVLSNGTLSVPIRLENITSILGCHVVVSYEGTVEEAEFIPTTYLYEPIIIQPKVDHQNNTILFALAARNGRVTRLSGGIVGTLEIRGNVERESIEVVQAQIADENIVVRDVLDTPPQNALNNTEQAEGPDRVLVTALYQSYPNPANPVTTISFSLKDATPVTLQIYNVLGSLVRTLVSETLRSDEYHITWDARDDRGNVVSSGIYFYRLTAGTYVDQKKLVILK